MKKLLGEIKIKSALLKQQMDRASNSDADHILQSLLNMVESAYEESNNERRLLENMMEAMSQELMEGNQDLINQAQQLRKSQERYDLAALASNDGLWDWDLETGHLYYSTRWNDMLGMDHDNTLSNIDIWFERVYPEDQNIVKEALVRHLKGLCERFEVEYRLRNEKGQYIWVHTRGLAARDASGRAFRLAGSQTNITYRKEYEASLYQAAFHDELTGLPNRALFLDRLNQTIQRLNRSKNQKAATLFLDLDRFKYINDSMGHDTGDEVLKIVSEVLKKHTRSTDTCSRLGGDEFTLLLDPIESVHEAKKIADRLLKALNKPYTIFGKEIYISSSIGLALVDPDSPDPQSVLRNADLAMYNAKTKGKSRLEIFDTQQHEKVIQRMEMESDLRYALNNDGLCVYYQPIVDLHTGKISGFESLIRWHHPTKGFISPADFIPLAEEVGLIGDIGQFVLTKAVFTLLDWLDNLRIKKCPHISVNISVRQLMDTSQFEKICAILSTLGGKTSFITLEITESVIITDPDLVTRRLKKIKALGVKISIDDFGTGYSSLSYLHNFQFDFLKIDQSFIASMIKDQKSQRLVLSIIGMAQDLNLKTIAEGVETLEQLHILKNLGCPYGQGFLFSKAQEASCVTQLLLDKKCYSECLTPSIASKKSLMHS